nr:SNF2-related protein [Rhodococcus sp. IEGM 1379]
MADPTGELETLGLPVGTPATYRMAVPIDDVIAPTVVAVQVIEFAEAVQSLRTLRDDHAGIGESVLAWKRVIDTRELQSMPTAAHASLDRDDTVIKSATSTATHFLHALTVRDELDRAQVQATLRPYQMQGVAWLTALTESGGGILADEMGRGKTLQAISMIAVRAAHGPHLVVCPTSVIGNWRREINRFAPHLTLPRRSSTRLSRSRIRRRWQHRLRPA